MLKFFIRIFSIAAMLILIPALLFWLLAPYFSASHEFAPVLSEYVASTRLISLSIRLMAYALVLYAWPSFIAKRLGDNSENTRRIIQKGRIAFIIALIALELFYWVGQL